MISLILSTLSCSK